jgi:hypothetical protein
MQASTSAIAPAMALSVRAVIAAMPARAIASAMAAASTAGIGPVADAVEPAFHCVRTHWIRGFMAFQLARCTRIVLLVVPA